MIHVDRPRLDGEKGLALIRQAEKGREALVAAFDREGRTKVDEKLYKLFKEFLRNAFNGKCAYCETKIAISQPGDVEHFRPKGRVVDKDFKPIKVQHPKWGEIEHPGYFWLAYDWENLLPSCIDCNRYRCHDGDGAGKADRFPVEGAHACVPGDETKENPLLIDPSKLDPDEHLTFKPNGFIAAKTPKGQETLDNLGLNVREELLKARGRAYLNAKTSFEAFIDAMAKADAERKELYRPAVNDVWNGEAEYSAVGRLGLEEVRARFRLWNVELPLPLPAE